MKEKKKLKVLRRNRFLNRTKSGENVRERPTKNDEMAAQSQAN